MVRWKGSGEEGLERAETPPKDPGGQGKGGRDTLINRLLKTVEMSLGEAEGKVPSPKKSSSGKQKRASVGASTPSPLPSEEPIVPVASFPSTGGKVKRKKGRVEVAGGKEGGGDNDPGSIIDRLLQMSKRELLGTPEETPRGKKRKADGSSTPSIPAKVMAMAREGDRMGQESALKVHQGTIAPMGEGVKWNHAPLPSDKSVSSKAQRLSMSALLEVKKSPVPLKVKRKSLNIKTENFND
jgi:hypothetical protein